MTSALQRIVLAAMALVGFASCAPPLTPALLLQEMLDSYANHSFHPFVGEGSRKTRGELRGVSLAEAEAMLAQCANARDWTYVGDEPFIEGDTIEDAGDRYAIMACARSNGSLVARLSMTWQGVDHRSELIEFHSDFLACRTGQCPDFAVGEPGNSDRSRLAPKFKVEKPVK